MSAASDKERTDSAGGTGRALVPFQAPHGRASAWPSFQHGLLVAAFGLALGVGAASVQGVKHAAAAWTATHAEPDPQTAALHQLQGEVGRLQASLEALRTTAETAKSDEPLRGLRHSVETLKQDVEQVRSSSAASAAQLAAKIDRADHDPAPKLAEIAVRLDRMEHAAPAPKPDAEAVRVSDLASRVDRIERQVSTATPTGSIPTVAAHAAPVQAIVGKPVAVPPMRAEVTTVPASEPRPAPLKPAPLEGWVLRDVYDGLALVQARSGGLREVGPGEYLPGAGEVRSIERRGRGWVILTSRGVIDNARF